MTVKISVFAVVLILAYVRADFDQQSTLSLTMPPMSYYPIENSIFNEFKKSVYTMNQAIINLIATARSAFNYNSLYKDQQDLNLEISEKLSKFEKSINYFENKLLKYRQSLINYKNWLGTVNTQPQAMDDDIPVDRDILL
ncbi:hypothetical protein ACI65C_009431 [Semiaphis heraclei]